MASMKALVPDLAIVPSLSTSSLFFMSAPESSIVSVELDLSGMIKMKKFGRAYLLWIGYGLVADLERIRYELTQRDFFGVNKCVDNQAHQLAKIR